MLAALGTIAEARDQSETSIAKRWAFFVNTTGCAGDLKRHLGSADYSYGFVLKALEPVLDRLGTWQMVDRPESRLSELARKARAEGLEPIYLILHPPHNAYFAADVPTILFPFWEFPQIPDRAFRLETRQNWRRMCEGADLIVTACRFTAEAFQTSGLERPIIVAPVPIGPEPFATPDWDPDHEWTIDCRHLILGGDEPAAESIEPVSPTTQAIPFWKRAIRGGYRRYVRRWLNPRAIAKIQAVRRKLLRIPDEPLPLLPSRPLKLSGLIYTSLFNPSDRRKNAWDLLTAYLLAFQDRPDVTLVLKLATSPTREYYDLQEFRAWYDKLGLKHRCRVVLVTDFLTDEQMRALYRVTTFYVNTSKAEGACLPLQNALAAGRPAIAPRHTAMIDYIDESVGFVVGSHREPTFWPHDPDQRTETYWQRLVWTDLRDAFLDSEALIRTDRDRYQALAAAARSRMANYADLETVTEQWSQAIQRLVS